VGSILIVQEETGYAFHYFDVVEPQKLHWWKCQSSSQVFSKASISVPFRDNHQRISLVRVRQLESDDVTALDRVHA
jgi:hypothetical protein